ncbi:MAG: reverse transcriptase-like protein [Novosphingobium sp.]
MKVYFDGGCRPNPGAIETAVVAGGKVFYRTDHGPGDNNDAEWLALIDALRVARDLGLADVTLLGDSAMVVDQANGMARRIAPRFRAHLAKFREEADGFGSVHIRRVGRKQNLAGIALERASGRI